MSKEILDRHGELKSIRQLEEPAWRDVAHLLRPDGDNFDNIDNQNARDDYDVFDSTGIQSVNNFSGGMFSQAANPASRWFDLGTPDEDLKRWKPVKENIALRTRLVYSSCAPAISRFYEEVSPWFADLGVFGNGVLSQEEWLGHQQLIDRAIPIAETFMDTDAAGAIDTLHREFMLTGRQVRQRFRDTAPSAIKEAQRYKIIHAVFPNPEFVQGRLGPAGMMFRSAYCSPDIKDFYVEGGFNEFPYHVVQWNRRSSRVWATGPGHDARPDLNTLNEMERSDLVSAQFEAEPILLTRDESAITAADLVPNAALEGTMSDDGKPLAQFLEKRSNSNRTTAKAEARRAAIRQAFLFSAMQVAAQRPQMTAAEAMAWQEEGLRAAAPNLVRVQNALARFIARRHAILDRAGQLPPAPPELQGKGLTVEFVSPLAKAQKLATGRSALQLVGAYGQVAAQTGDPSIFDNLDSDALANVLSDTICDIPELQRDPRLRDQIRAARAQSMQQQQQLESMGQAADIAATVSHAVQAKTVADKRAQK